MVPSNEKVPIPPIPPPSNLYKPISFWADIMLSLDQKIQYMETNRAYGEVSVTFKVWNGKITDIIWDHKINDKVSVGKIGVKNPVSPENGNTGTV